MDVEYMLKIPAQAKINNQYWGRYLKIRGVAANILCVLKSKKKRLCKAARVD